MRHVAGERTVYSLKSATTLAVLRVCGWVAVVCGLLFAAIGIALVLVSLTAKTDSAADGWWTGAVVILSAPFACWAGWSMLIYGVRLSPRRLASGGTILRGCSRGDVVAIDVRRRYGGPLARTVPFDDYTRVCALICSARAGPASSSSRLASKVGSNGSGIGLGATSTQPEVVARLRSDLEVDGTDVPA